ncbi:hypothetical protein CMI42_06550 [Candidatus Pacearchaeota archaeon]|nr:hypothetical protein [Candidatus Pacearchaeota archaeon]
MKNRITKKLIDRYYGLSSKALEMARKVVVKGKEKEAGEIFKMAECYLSDALHFKEKGDLVNAYGALNYAHGWLDCGAGLKIYRVKDNRLFTV